VRRLLIAATAAAVANTCAAQTPPSLQVRLAPAVVDAKAGRGFVDVSLTVPAVDAPAGAALLTLPIVIANTDTIANTLTGLSAADAAGPVTLIARDDPVAIAYSRHWSATRAVKGDLVVRYRAPVDDTPPARGSGPPYSLRTEGGGVSGVGNTFILIPENPRPYPIALTWDLSALGAGAHAIPASAKATWRCRPVRRRG
jgi:hypothetical protein